MDETKAKRLRTVRSWRRHWCEFLPSIGITGDVFLDEFSTWQRQHILVAFAQSIQNYCGKSNQRRAWLQAGTVKYSIGYLSQAFKADHQSDPHRDAGGDICDFLLEQTYRGYTNQDPGGVVQQQKALPAVSVLKMMQKLATTNLANAQTNLAEGSFFFLRSCEYSKTSTKEESKYTKIIRVYNIKFFANSRIRHHDHDQLEDSDFVQITFEYMKNDDRNESVRMFKA